MENKKFFKEGVEVLEFFNMTKVWYLNGLRHREDGPAIELANGNKYWYYHGQQVICSSNEEFLKIIKLRMFW